MDKKLKGVTGEDIAERFLINSGYKIFTRNFRSKIGEIDIIALHQNTLVFVEVKTRWSRRFGAPVEAVTTKKYEKIKNIPNYFILKHP